MNLIICLSQHTVHNPLEAITLVDLFTVVVVDDLKKKEKEVVKYPLAFETNMIVGKLTTCLICVMHSITSILFAQYFVGSMLIQGI